jgi:hypothetical protein
MNVMDQTITGAASGETVFSQTAPKDSQSQVKGQKINQYISAYCPGSSYPLKQIGVSNLFFSYIHNIMLYLRSNQK